MMNDFMSKQRWSLAKKHFKNFGFPVDSILAC